MYKTRSLERFSFECRKVIGFGWQLSGKLSRLKNKHARKNAHASGLNTNGGKHIKQLALDFAMLARSSYISFSKL